MWGLKCIFYQKRIRVKLPPPHLFRTLLANNPCNIYFLFSRSVAPLKTIDGCFCVMEKRLLEHREARVYGRERDVERPARKEARYHSDGTYEPFRSVGTVYGAISSTHPYRRRPAKLTNLRFTLKSRAIRLKTLDRPRAFLLLSIRFTFLLKPPFRVMHKLLDTGSTCSSLCLHTLTRWTDHFYYLETTRNK